MDRKHTLAALLALVGIGASTQAIALDPPKKDGDLKAKEQKSTKKGTKGSDSACGEGSCGTDEKGAKAAKDKAAKKAADKKTSGKTEKKAEDAKKESK